jgi:hypothetical protein
MDEIRDDFAAGRRAMIDAFVEMSMLARRAGVDPDAVTALHGVFFDGNVQTKRAFRVAVLLAEAGR